MKFLHLSTGDVRGAFTGAYRLHENLKAAGHESKMFVRMKDSKDPDVLESPICTQILGKISAKLFNSMYVPLRIDVNEFYKRYFFPYWGLVKLGSLFKRVEFCPDLIIVYYVANFLSADDLKKIQSHYNAPVAFYLMDAGMLTGGCHYPWDCVGFMNECGNCPIFKKTNEDDWSRKIWNNRRAAFNKMKYSVIAGSSWLYAMTEKSSLHRGRRIDKILMGIDTKVYKPRDRFVSRTELGLTNASDSIIIYFGAQQLEDPRKGFSYLFSALQLLQLRLSEELKKKLVLLTVGAQQPVSLGNLDFRHHHISYLHDKTMFAKTYNAADVFICPSVEDAGPMMINEAMMSGTPVIAFKMGVAEDLIIEGITGFLVNNFDSEEMSQKIMDYILLDEDRRKEMSVNCKVNTEKYSSQVVQVTQLISLTGELKTIMNSHSWPE